VSTRRRTKKTTGPGAVRDHATLATLELFALRYLANGRNATLAYAETHPRAKKTTCMTQGSMLLRHPKVEAILHRETEARRQRLRMEADEALVGISMHARGDIRRLYDEHGHILPIKLWPDDIADCVKGIKPTPNGWQLILYDKLRARELMAIAGGKLRQAVDHTHSFDHARYLADEPPEGDE
jgi:hypothetical protein